MLQLMIAGQEKSRPLCPLFAGWEQCEAAHRYGPHIREYCLLHFVLSGKGWLRDKNGEHAVCAGEAFVIRPNEVTVYEADSEEPWCYCWLAFRGEDADAFLECPTVLCDMGALGERLAASVRAQVAAPEIYLSLLYELLYVLRRDEKHAEGGEDRLQEICRYVHYNYMHDLRVSELSRLFGFERSYLYRLFKERFGISVKDHITAVRMEHAKEFLRAGHTVGQTACMVGYSDVLVFSHAFKKYSGKTATQLRNGT